VGLYEVLWYSSYDPCYFLIDGIEGETPEHALRNNLKRLTQEVKKRFDIEDVPDEDIHDTLYVLRDDGLVSGSRIKNIPPSVLATKSSATTSQKASAQKTRRTKR